MTDEEIIKEAEQMYALPSDDNVLIQTLGTDYIGNLEIVDRVDDGAWVMAWVWVPVEKGEAT